MAAHTVLILDGISPGLTHQGIQWTHSGVQAEWKPEVTYIEVIKQCGVLQNHAKSGDSFSHCEFCHPILSRKAMGVTLSEENCLVVCVSGKGLEGQ